MIREIKCRQIEMMLGLSTHALAVLRPQAVFKSAINLIEIEHLFSLSVNHLLKDYIKLSPYRKKCFAI
ncbi:hypothetical protein C2134_11485 [Chromobacterium sinusclupearum]|uniref:Uncharacterized protein n=1 Tax=Chromobacterium sinusclupearum TaxID=2077146 RepID=A0A2K4MN80_9NEIS|nr:hypothetical protein C2134_11485 [Chromobacterium sinusclupearum]